MEGGEVPLSFGLKGHNAPFLKVFRITILLLQHSRIDIIIYKGVMQCTFKI